MNMSSKEYAADTELEASLYRVYKEVEPGVWNCREVLQAKEINGNVVNSDTVIVFGDVKGNITNADNVVVIGGDIKGNITHADTVIRDTRTNLEKFLEDDDIVSKIKAEQNDSIGIRYEVR